MAVNAPTSDPPTPRLQAANRAAPQRERAWAARAKERWIYRQERFNRYSEDYRLREQQGPSPLPELVNSSSNVEESEGERAGSGRWEPRRPHRQGSSGSALNRPTRRAQSHPPLDCRQRHRRALRRWLSSP
jgi:hypothetical protein